MLTIQNYSFLFVFLLCHFLIPTQAQDTVTWQDMHTVEEVCQTYPDRMKGLLESLNLNQDGLLEVQSAYAEGKIALACQQLLDYYKQGNQASFLQRELPPVSKQTDPLADSMLQDIFTVQRQAGHSPRLASGHLDWFYQGPQDDKEWAWGVNRHYHLRTLLDIYFQTGNLKYAKGIDSHIKDWVLSSLPYPAEKSSTAMWRGLEVSFRVKIWARIFHGLLESETISPATRLLLLSSLPEHAHYARNFHAEGNWLTMELSGLAMVAIAWPEFKESAAWLVYAKEKMAESMDKQVYPDGVQTELTSHYHYVALKNFDLFRELCQEADVPLAESFTQQIEDMWNYLAYTMRPDGFGIMNNDSDRDENRARILKAAEEYDREDWRFIASNEAEGSQAEAIPSSVFPWAGQMIMRDGYTKDAHWAFFDMGPWGSGHQHDDMLHLSIAAYGRDFLVDGGRFAYRGALADQFRGYARSTHSHNALLIDGQGQKAGPKLAGNPLSAQHYRMEEDFDYAWHTFDQFEDLEGSAAHTRAVLYIRGKFWIVVDHIETDRPRTIETMWHWHPDCEVRTEAKQSISASRDMGTLQISPISKQTWNIKHIKGQEEPAPQGWYSEEYNKAEPATASMYATEISKASTMVWLLFPSKDGPIKRKAKIRSLTSDHVVIQVKHARDKWEMHIPFADSEKVDVTCQTK